MSKKTFYVCSFGGCGSTVLTLNLKKYGKVYHIHSRKPPLNIEHVGGSCYREWFNGTPVSKTDEHYVIYIYRNPVSALLSLVRRWPAMKAHLHHIQSPYNSIDTVINKMKDLYKLDEFYTNYTTPNNRKYKIYCIKYEDLFENQNKLSEVLNIGTLNITKNEHPYTSPLSDKLTIIYNPLIKKMNKMPFITIV